MPFRLSARLTKEFELHLFEFASSEDKFLGRYFVSKGLTLLRNSERYFHGHGLLNVLKLYKHRLRCLRSEINRTGFNGFVERLLELRTRQTFSLHLIKKFIERIYRTDRGPKHEIKLPLIRELRASAVGAYVATVAYNPRHLLS